jgi:hypothetical protein
MSPIHPRAAAIDVGAKMHVAAVGPDRASEPVRTFGTFTGTVNLLGESRELGEFAGEQGAAGYAACLMLQTSCYAWKARVRSAR